MFARAVVVALAGVFVSGCAGAKRTNGNVAAILCTRGASSRLTRPGTAFCSCNAAGTRASDAAIITGRLG